MKFALATGNQGKVKEMREILSEMSIEAVTQGELGISVEIEETGTTFLENSRLKARAICAASGLPAIADDSGLVVHALGGEPGVYSSSYGGDGLDDVGRYAHLIKKMENMEQRGAKFVSTIVCVFPDGREVATVGECHGEILTEARGNGGFGYDPVFFVTSVGKSMAELSPGEKNSVSHRGVALRKFAKALIDLGAAEKC